jgi:hypothetical protein
MRASAKFVLLLALASLGAAVVGRAGTATSVSGLYYTGTNNSGGTLSGGSQDTHWDVVYAQVGGTVYTGASTYTGDAYVVSNSYIDSAWVPNSSTAKWIVPPGAKTTGGTANVGGDLLPGNGNAGVNEAIFVYRLAFTINGTGTVGSAVGNQVSISLTIAADDQYTIYVNPTLDANGNVTSAAAGSRTNAWNNTSAEYLQNYAGNGHADNSDFVIGTNYIYVVVDNTNSINGSSTSTALNPSGLLVYQVGTAVVISSTPVPEVGTILPVVGALGLFGLRFMRRRFGAGPTSPTSA